MAEAVLTELSWHRWPAFLRWLLVSRFRKRYTVSRQLSEAERYLLMTEASRLALRLDGFFSRGRFTHSPDGACIMYGWRTNQVAMCHVIQCEDEMKVDLSFIRLVGQGFWGLFYGLLFLAIPLIVREADYFAEGLGLFALLLSLGALMQLLSAILAGPAWRYWLNRYLLGLLKRFGLEAEVK